MKKIFLTFLVLLISGNALAKREPASGSLEISRQCQSKACIYTYTLTNTAQTWQRPHTLMGYTIKPTLEVSVYDCSGNTLDQDKIYFDQIMRGKYQKKRRVYDESEDGTAKIYIKLALSGRYEGTSRGHRLKHLAGVDGRTYSWGCEN